MSVCIVTGAARGNGLATAKHLRADGHDVIAIDVEPIPDGVASHAIVGDVLDDAVMQGVYARALDYGTEVHLVNNAGITSPEFPQGDAVWERTLAINLTAPFRWSRAYAAHVASGAVTQGGIVFVGSLATALGFPRNPAYQASKSALLGLTRSFAYDLGTAGIRVNCVSPGYIHTAMTETSFAHPALNEARRKHTLLGRWGTSDDVAGAISFLCSEKASYITGINLPVDGGWMACGLIE